MLLTAPKTLDVIFFLTILCVVSNIIGGRHHRRRLRHELRKNGEANGQQKVHRKVFSSNEDLTDIPPNWPWNSRSSFYFQYSNIASPNQKNYIAVATDHKDNTFDRKSSKIGGDELPLSLNKQVFVPLDRFSNVKKPSAVGSEKIDNELEMGRSEEGAEIPPFSSEDNELVPLVPDAGRFVIVRPIVHFGGEEKSMSKEFNEDIDEERISLSGTDDEQQSIKGGSRTHSTAGPTLPASAAEVESTLLKPTDIVPIESRGRNSNDDNKNNWKKLGIFVPDFEEDDRYEELEIGYLDDNDDDSEEIEDEARKTIDFGGDSDRSSILTDRIDLPLADPKKGEQFVEREQMIPYTIVTASIENEFLAPEINHQTNRGENVSNDNRYDAGKGNFINRQIENPTSINGNYTRNMANNEANNFGTEDMKFDVVKKKIDGERQNASTKGKNGVGHQREANVLSLSKTCLTVLLVVVSALGILLLIGNCVLAAVATFYAKLYTNACANRTPPHQHNKKLKRAIQKCAEWSASLTGSRHSEFSNNANGGTYAQLV